MGASGSNHCEAYDGGNAVFQNLKMHCFVSTISTGAFSGYYYVI